MPGFDEIIGVDIAPQPRYPFSFVQARRAWSIWQSTAKSSTRSTRARHAKAIASCTTSRGYSGREYPLLILPTIEMLEALGKPYAVENVMGARHGSKTLQKRGLRVARTQGWAGCAERCSGKPFYRHRLFASELVLAGTWASEGTLSLDIPGQDYFGQSWS